MKIIKESRTEFRHIFDAISKTQFDSYLVVAYESTIYDNCKEQMKTESCSNWLIDEYDKVEYG